MIRNRKPVNDLFDLYEFNEVTASYYPEGVVKTRLKISSSRDAHKYLLSLFYADSVGLRESFMALFVNRANLIVAYSRVSEGGITGTIADPRLIMQKAILTNACSMVIAHNHPSGNLKPSESDVSLTKKLNECANFFEIKLLDHIIISGLFPDSYFSFADEGLI